MQARARASRPRREPGLLAAAAIAGSLFARSLAACRGSPSSDPPSAGVSPQAKAEPAELENLAVTSSTQLVAPDAGRPPIPLRSDEGVASDALWKESGGWELEATLRTSEIPPAFRGPETAIAAIDAVKKKTEPRLVVDITAARLRIELASTGFVLPQGTELRSRNDRFGQFLILPNERQYRIAPPGTLRPLLGERRIDVEPLVPAVVAERGEGGRRLGYRTRKVEVTNRAGTATFELGRLSEAGDGGALLCRALLDLLNAPPATPVCAQDEVPLHVDWRWVAKGALTFEVTAASRRTELTPPAMSAPPLGYAFTGPSLPERGAEALVDQAELVAFRTAPADVPAPMASRSFPPPQRDGSAGPIGLTLANTSDEMRLAWLDGAPVAWVAPGASLVFPALFRGRYGFAWRTFLGDAYDAPITITVPAVVTASTADAGP